MFTVLLWITLITSIILLIAVAAPIRVSCKAVYKEEGRDTEFNAAAYYLHPLILRAEYSSADEQAKFFILGFKKKQGRNKDGEAVGQGINTEDSNASGIDTNDINTNGIDTENINTDGINTEGTDINTDNAGGIDTENINASGIDTDDINTNGIDTDNINADGINTEDTDAGSINTDNADAKEKKRFGLSKIKSMLNDIKRNRLYKIIGSKSLRNKLLRWLKRSFVCAVRAVSFEKLKLRARIGLQDPAALGKMYGYFSAAQSALSPRYYNIDLSMEPVFNEKRFDIDSELKIKTTLSIILWQLTVIAATFPFWRIWRIIKIKN